MKSGLSNILTPPSESPRIATVWVLQRLLFVSKRRRLENLRKFCVVWWGPGWLGRYWRYLRYPEWHLVCYRVQQWGPVTHCLSEVKRPQREADYRIWSTAKFNHLTPNDPYIGRTAPLICKVAFYTFIQQIYVPNILNMIYTLRIFLLKMQFVS